VSKRLDDRKCAIEGIEKPYDLREDRLKRMLMRTRLAWVGHGGVMEEEL